VTRRGWLSGDGKGPRPNKSLRESSEHREVGVKLDALQTGITYGSFGR
jgi:hypothetical protein